MTISSRRSLLVLLFILIVSSRATQSATPQSSEIQRRMQAFVDDGTIAGAVTLVARHDRILSLNTVGYADLVARKPMRTDNLFWIASMTKPMTAVAVLILQDEGKLNFEDRVDKYLPEFTNQWMIAENRTNSLVLKRPSRPITIRDLLTHASGVGNVNAPRANSSLAELVIAYAREPLQYEPGSRWSYNNAGINTLGRIVEVVSGQPYADFLQKRIFNPLDMKDTTFWPALAQTNRLARSYRDGTVGRGLEVTAISFLRGDLSDRTRTPIPAGGLFSTARDIARFYQMTLNGGTLNGKRIISADSLSLMTRTQSGSLRTGFTDGMSWGLGFSVVKEPQGVTAMLSPGSYGHGGAYGTQSWADPKKDLIYILMIQRAGLPNSDNSTVRKAFQEAAAATFGN